MSKRGTGDTGTFKKRKRKRNGVSFSSSVLDPVDTPPPKPRLMRVWHTNVEDPSMSRRSVVPIPPEPQLEGPRLEEVDPRVEGEGSEVTESTSIPVLVQPKRKRGNNSVS